MKKNNCEYSFLMLDREPGQKTAYKKPACCYCNANANKAYVVLKNSIFTVVLSLYQKGLKLVFLFEIVPVGAKPFVTIIAKNHILVRRDFLGNNNCSFRYNIHAVSSLYFYFFFESKLHAFRNLNNGSEMHGIPACDNHTNRDYPYYFQQKEKICNNIFHVNAPAFYENPLPCPT